MNRTVISLLLMLFVCTSSFAQEQKPSYNALLWRISGKGLSKNSYLYGTMHVTDKRLFYFTDSLYHFLEQTEGYAAELDVQEMMSRLITMLNDQQSDKRLLQDVMKPEELAAYKKKLEKKLKKPLKEISIQNLKSARSSYMKDLYKKGEMSTIMDMYLFDIARRRNKWVGGIEDYEDQFKAQGKEEEAVSLINEALYDKKEMKSNVEWMIGVYLDQQLDKIDLSEEMWKGAEKQVLNRRNVKMARRIDSIMNIRSCFFAVGAAHIPGDSGVVKLLREKGFVVEPVYSSVKIAPEQYNLALKDIPWQNAQPENNWYNIQMPGKPEVFNSNKDLPFKPLMYIDLLRMNFYFSFGSPLPKSKQIDKEELYKNFAAGFTEKGSIKSNKDILVDSVEGKEYIIKSDDADMRLQILIPGRSLIVNIMASFKEDSLYGDDAKRYFGSLRINPLKEEETELVKIGTIGWNRYNFPRHAFNISFPQPFKHRKGSTPAVDSVWNVNSYYATDESSQATFWMMVMEAKEGYYSNADTGYFSSVKENLNSYTGSDPSFFHTYTFEGYPACSTLYRFQSEKQPLTMAAKVVQRGNRRYYYYAVYEPTPQNDSLADQYFQSFHLTSYLPQEWKIRTSPHNDFTIWSPADVHVKKEEGDSITTYLQVHDTAISFSLLVKKETLSPYYWWKSDSIFFADQKSRFVSATDTILAFEEIRSGSLKGVDFTVGMTDNHNVKKVRMILNGDTLYSFFGFLPLPELQTDDYKKLFNDIRFLKEKNTNLHLQNRTSRILTDMKEGDSTDFANATEALSDATFDKEDLPLLQNALLIPYRDFDPSSFCAHDKIIRQVLDNDDGSTIGFIEKNYSSLKGENEILRYSFLSMLVRLQTSESFSLLKKLLLTQKPVSGDPITMSYSLNDSLELTKILFPEIASLASDTGFIQLFPRIIPPLIDSGLVKISVFEPYYKYFYEYADKKIRSLKQEGEDAGWDIPPLCKLLGYFKTAGAYEKLQQFSIAADLEVKQAAILALLVNNQQVGSAEINKLAADKLHRINFYNELKSLGKEKLFPKKFINQQLFAESELYNIASDEDEPGSIVFVAKKTVLFKKEKKVFYLFKIDFGTKEEPNAYLGIAGPYDEKILTNSVAGGLYYEENFDARRIDQQLKAYLSQFEEEGE